MSFSINRTYVIISALALGLAMLVAPGVVSSATTHTVCDTGCDYSTIQAAVDAANPGDTVKILSDLTTSEEISLDKSITLEGNGNTINADFEKTNNSNNSAVGVGSDNVTIKNVTLEDVKGATWPDQLHGVNVYKSVDVVLENVTANNFGGSGILVNGSTVDASNITTSGNTWHAINVDQGSGVTQPAVLNVSNTSSHDENSPAVPGDFVDGESVPHIFIDDVNANATVNDLDSQYDTFEVPFRGGTARVYTLKGDDPEGALGSEEEPHSGNVSICHTQDSGDTWSNPNPNVNGIVNEGHGGHEDDIIPPFWYEGTGQNQGIHFYEGNNWEGNNIDLWNNNCGVENEPEAPNQCLLDEEMLENGGFEKPVVGTNANWNIFPNGTSDLGWTVEWVAGLATPHNGEDLPEDGQLEIHKELWDPFEGLQYAELDSDWFGPSNSSFTGEESSTEISQTVPTVEGEWYKISFAYSPRPDTAESNNVLEVYWGGDLIDTISRAGSSETDWSEHTYTKQADAEDMELRLVDAGTPDGLGTFVDGVSVMCVECEKEHTIYSDEETLVDGEPSVEIDPHPNWTEIDGSQAEWIWSEAKDENGSHPVGTETFTREFEIAGTPNGATLYISTDNGYSVSLNGDPLCSDDEDQNWSSVDTCSIDAEDLQNGTNTITFEVENFEGSGQNPAGLLYELIVHENQCLLPEEPETDNITIEKWNDENENKEWDDNEHGLEGWEMVVKPQDLEAVETLTVPSDENGATTVTSLDSEKTYLVEVDGTWLNDRNEGPNYVDAEYSTIDNWDTFMDGFTGSGEDILDLKINGNLIHWGSYNGQHLYKTIVNGDNEPLTFQVHENGNSSWYNDNEGSLNVRIYDVTSNIVATGPDGTTEVEVDPGEYQIIEIQQEGWTQTAPVNPSYCHINTEEGEAFSCSFGNVEEGQEGEGGGGSTQPEEMHEISVAKWNDTTDPIGNWDDGEEGISGWEIVIKPQTLSPVQTLFVDSSEEIATTTDFALEEDTRYLIEAEGTYVFGGDRVADAEYYDSDNSWGSPTDWGADNPSEDQRTLDLIIDDQNINWGPYNSNNLYKKVVSGNGEPVTLRIFERQSSHYSDNSGKIEVRIYEITDDMVVETGNDGWHHEEVPSGEYQIVEIMQEGWTQTSPGMGYCHIEVPGNQDTCTFGNFYTEPEPDPSEQEADLSVTKINEGDRGQGGTLTYTIEVENAGPDDATGVVVKDVLPAGVSYISDDSGGDYNPSTGEWTVGSVASGPLGKQTLNIDVEVIAGVEEKVTNTATTTALQIDPEDENNVDSTSFIVDGNTLSITTSGGGDGNDDDNPGGNGPPVPNFVPQVAGATFGDDDNGDGGDGDDNQNACTDPYLTSYLKQGDEGPQVVLLQAFLNEHMGAGLSITGTFGGPTHTAVENFQSTYAEDILLPWGIANPTGHVYYTTQKKINEIVCEEGDFSLTPDQLAEIEDTKDNNEENESSEGGSSDEGNEEEGEEVPDKDEGEGNEDQSASVGNQESGFWISLWNLFF